MSSPSFLFPRRVDLSPRHRRLGRRQYSRFAVEIVAGCPPEKGAAFLVGNGDGQEAGGVSPPQGGPQGGHCQGVRGGGGAVPEAAVALVCVRVLRCTPSQSFDARRDFPSTSMMRRTSRSRLAGCKIQRERVNKTEGCHPRQTFVGAS